MRKALQTNILFTSNNSFQWGFSAMMINCINEVKSKSFLLTSVFFLSLSLCKHSFICTNYIRKSSGLFVYRFFLSSRL